MIPTAVLEAACQRLARSATWFPKVAELVEECRVVTRFWAAQARPSTALAPGDQPVSETQVAELRARVAAAVERRRFTP